MRFYEILSEAAKKSNKKQKHNGDCFVAAGNVMLKQTIPGLELVHAYVSGQGPAAGMRFSHAWNEVGDVVFDFSNQRKIIMRREDYYALGKVDQSPGQYARYTRDQALEKIAEIQTYGPWDLDPKYEQIQVSETPLVDYEPLGRFDRPGGFRHAVDRRLVTNPVSVGKIHQFFAKTGQDIRIFPVQFPGGSRWLETGEVSPQKLTTIVGKKNAQRILQGHIGNTITVVFTNNTGVERIPLTAWMMAHRLGHAIARSAISNHRNGWLEATRHWEKTTYTILEDYYGIGFTIRLHGGGRSSEARIPGYGQISGERVLRSWYSAIGNMRSARQGLIKRPDEFVYDLFAQYLGTGQVQFNPAPRQLNSRELNWGRPRWQRSIDALGQQEATYALETLARDMEIMFNDVLSNAEGHIYVM